METKVWNLLDTKNISYGGRWDDVKSTVRAKVFATMLELSRDRVKYYCSDLYHDALWLDKELTGPMQFDWVARESGTFIGDVVNYINDDVGEKSVKYRFELIEDNAKWILNIYEAGPLAIPVTLHTPVYGSQNMLPTDVDYSENEAYQLQMEKDESLLVVTVENPTLRNGSIETHERKEPIHMDSILQELREKLDEANSARDEANDRKYELDDVLNELSTYIDDLENLVNSLEDIPEISVEFEVSIEFRS